MRLIQQAIFWSFVGAFSGAGLLSLALLAGSYNGQIAGRFGTWLWNYGARQKWGLLIGSLHDGDLGLEWYAPVCRACGGSRGWHAHDCVAIQEIHLHIDYRIQVGKLINLPGLHSQKTTVGRGAVYDLDVSLWLVTPILLLLPATAFVQLGFRRRRLRRAGCCRSCGYDLRGTPERCPECGMEKVVK